MIYIYLLSTQVTVKYLDVSFYVGDLRCRLLDNKRSGMIFIAMRSRIYWSFPSACAAAAPIDSSMLTAGWRLFVATSADSYDTEKIQPWDAVLTSSAYI